MYKITFLQLLAVWISGVTGWLWIINLDWEYYDLELLAHDELISYFFLAKSLAWLIPSILVFYTLGWVIHNKKKNKY